MRILLMCFFCTITLQNYLCAQNIRNEKFGSIKIEDFNPASPVIEDDSPAIILSDVGSTEFVGNNQGWFTLLFKRHRKVLIKKRTAFDLATVSITLYDRTFEYEEKLEDVEAATYNLTDGKIVTTKLQNKEDILKEKLDKSNIAKKFTLPDVKEGSIIEYSYTIKRKDVRDLDDWRFQTIYPTLWSEYQVLIPPMFNYAQQRKGMIQQYTIDSSKKMFKTYNVIVDHGINGNENINVNGDATWALWALKDVPAFKLESFTSTLKNHLSRIEFQLHSIKYSERETVQIIENWFATANKLLKAEYFGDIFDKEKHTWVTDESTIIVGNATGEEAAKKVYNYFKNTFTCTYHHGNRFTNEPKKIWKEKKGTVSDINLLLTAFLKSQGFKATPVLLSTTENGRADEGAALVNQYDYLICKADIDSINYMLDASHKNLGFGRLSANCYNGSGRCIAPMPILVNLSPDILLETKNTSIFIVNSETAKDKLEASFSSTLGYYESQELREDLINTKKEDLYKKWSKQYSFEPELSNTELENEKYFEQPVTVKYDMKFSIGDDDIIYFSPLLAEATKDNPFKSTKRNYPVEMPYGFDETIVLDMEIPKGYVVDEIPKSTRVKLNEDEGMFEYIIANRDGKIMLRCRTVIKKATFLPEDYNTLRDFWGMVVKKQAEQIVFKKVKQ